MRLLLSEILPLRSTRMLGDFATDAPLAHRYGDLTTAPFPLLRITDTEFFAADHPMEITGVNADDQPMQGWERAIRTDAAGNTYTVVLLSAPAPDNVALSAMGRGKRNQLTGALLENPADIMEDVMRIAGRKEIFPQLRAESAAAGLVLAGSIGDQALSIRATLDLIARSAAAIWTPAGGRLYPTGQVSGPVVDLTKMEASGFTVTAVIDDTADILRLSYDQNDVTGKPQRYMELTALPRRFGGIVVEMTLPWLRTPANAEATGRRVLSRMAGRRYRVNFSVNRIDIRPGAWMRIVDHPEWPTDDADPLAMALAVDITPETKTTTIEAECVLSTPTITVTAHSVSVPPTAGAAVDVTIVDGIATFTITDVNQQPIRNARVSFDGSAAKTTDAQGKVRFPATHGAHKLAVEAEGKTPFVTDILL